MNIENMKDGKSTNKIIILIVGLLTLISMLFLFMLNGMAPFGNDALPVVDAKIQYLDFFSYLKDVLNGENSVLYTFSKTLGGSNIAVLSYYLTSPFNLLVLLFDKSNLNSFFDIVVVLKVTLASMLFSYFLLHRFKNKNKNYLIYILFSIGYGLSQYNIAQSSNIMWLDGVYMLPVMLLNVYYLVNKENYRIFHLSVIVGVTIIFNWYSAGIDCLFAIFWFLLELCLWKQKNQSNYKIVLKKILSFGISMFLGVCLSAVLFLPTIGALQKSTRGSLDLDYLLNFSINGRISTVIQNYTYGSLSEYGSVALFCGCLVVPFVLYLFFNKEFKIREKIILGIFLVFSIMIYYWKPLFMLFSLLKSADSYFYRYSYVTIFTLLFLATYSSNEIKRKRDYIKLMTITFVFGIAIMIVYFKYPMNSFKRDFATVIALVVEMGLFVLVSSKKVQKVCYSIAFMLCGVGDLFINMNFLIKDYSEESVETYKSYYQEQERLISYVKEYDATTYRISQTSTNGVDANYLTANYNESLGYNYYSISGYTSSPDDIQLTFLDNVGYRKNSPNFCITNSSILGIDSLLGVKYLLTSQSMNGLEKICDGKKNIYYNPYSFPIAFIYNNISTLSNNAENPFEYQNSIYKQLFSVDDDLYTKVDYTFTDENNVIKVQLNYPENQNVILYGNAPWNILNESFISVNDELITKYACWLSPSVFYIPTTSDNKNYEVEISYSVEGAYDTNAMQFYALNLDVLEKCSEIANENAISDFSLENGKVSASVDAEEGERLFLSIAKDDGWDIQLNGKEANVEYIGDCLYSIQLNKGHNELVMTYHVKYLKLGIIVSLISVILMVVCFIIQKYRIKQI